MPQELKHPAGLGVRQVGLQQPGPHRLVITHGPAQDGLAADGELSAARLAYVARESKRPRRGGSVAEDLGPHLLRHVCVGRVVLLHATRPMFAAQVHIPLVPDVGEVECAEGVDIGV